MSPASESRRLLSPDSLPFDPSRSPVPAGVPLPTYGAALSPPSKKPALLPLVARHLPPPPASHHAPPSPLALTPAARLPSAPAAPDPAFAPPYLPSAEEIAATALDRFTRHRLLAPPRPPPLALPMPDADAEAAPLTGKRAEPALSLDEPVRDWSFGPVTGHRVLTLLCVTFLLWDDYRLQDLMWPTHEQSTGFRLYFAWGSILWLSTIIPSVLGLVGLLMYRYHPHLDEVQPTRCLVVWRIVARGTNRAALAETVHQVQGEMRRTPLFPYVVEVVTDVDAGLPASDDVVCLVVPDDYETANKSKFKARALHYALQYSTVEAKAWLVHLDEETRPTASGIRGVAEMVAQEEASGQLRIGQGAILYHRSWDEFPLLTLADTMRTGDDFARFYLQHTIGVTVFGLHGSYIVCRNDVEREVGFDFGPVGSVTEDAFWALKCMEGGRRSRWVHGFLEEQSTQSVMDFIKQRRRWYHGLMLVSLYAPVHWLLRLGLMVNTVLWSFAPFGNLYTVLNLFLGCSTNEVIRALANFSLAFYMTLYILGVEVNLKAHGNATFLNRVKWYVAVVVLLPYFSLIESLGVLMAIVKPETGFHVVKK